MRRSLAFARALGPRLALLLVALPAPALAQDTHAAAVQLFDAADALAASGHMAEACPKYGESYRLDPQLGALLHYADCLEQSGKLAGAYAAFRDAVDVAGQKGDERKAMAEGRAAALEPRLTRVAIELATDAKVPGLELYRDGTLLSEASLSMSLAVDPGEHRIEAKAPGYMPWSTTFSIDGEGHTKHVVIPALQAAPPAAVVPVTPTPARQSDVSSTTTGPSTFTWVAGGLAVVGLGTGIVLNVLARGANSDAQGQCLNGAASGSCQVLNASHAQERKDSLDIASMDRTISYIGFGVGGAAAAAAIVSLFIPRSNQPAQHALLVAPQANQTGGGLLMQGSF